MRHSTIRIVSLVFLTLLVITLAVPADAQSRGQLFARITDQDGAPVEGLTPDKFVVQEGGVNMDIISVEPGTTPMKMVLLVDNGDGVSMSNALGLLRGSMQRFFETLEGEHEIAIHSIAGNLTEVIDFTSDREALMEASNGLFGGRGGSRFIEGIMETWERRFSPDDFWPVITILTTDGPEVSGNVNEEQFRDFIIDLVGKAATVNVLVLSTQGGGIQTQIGQNLTTNTTGYYNSIVAPSGLSNAMEEMANAINEHYNEMSDRYRLVYERPGDEPGGQVGAGVAGQLNMQLFGDRRRQQ
mgnify:FL=1